MTASVSASPVSIPSDCSSIEPPRHPGDQDQDRHDGYSVQVDAARGEVILEQFELDLAELLGIGGEFAADDLAMVGEGHQFAEQRGAVGVLAHIPQPAQGSG